MPAWRVPTCLLSLAWCAAVGGCGAGEQEAPAPVGVQAENGVRAAVLEYFTAFADGDGNEACRHLEPAARDRLEREARQDSCPAAVERLAGDLVPELRSVLGEVEIVAVRTEDATAEATLRASDRYASERRGSQVRLRYRDGAWRLATLPEEPEEPDPVTTCVMGGIRSFENGESEPFWRKEGRKDFVVFITAVCKQGVEEGIFRKTAPRPPTADLERISAKVIQRMVARGRIEDPA